MNSRAELIRAYLEKARALGLTVDVNADGIFNAELAVVGEAPGEREVATHIPFSGGSGKVLWDSLRKYGITRQNVYITNVIKKQVSLGSEAGNVKIAISKNEVQHWNELLRWELEQLPNLRYVLLLGNYALNALRGITGITNWRGSVLDEVLLTRRVRCVATYNPAMVLREPKTALVFAFDIGKLDRVMHDKYKPVVIDAHINPTYEEALSWIAKVHKDGVESAPVSVDIEFLSMETACVGIASEDLEGYCINFRGLDNNRYLLGQERNIRRALQKLFKDTKVKFVGQNVQFDAYWLWYKDGIRIYKTWFDTLLAHHTLYPTLPHNLGFLTTQYTDHPYYKDERESWREYGGDIDNYWRYNVKDVCLTRIIQRKLLKELRQRNLDDFFFNHVMPIQQHLIPATVYGIKCDMGLKEHITEQISEDVANVLKSFYDAVHECTGDPEYYPNPRSPTQLGDLFFRKLKLVGRGPSTNAENRARMRAHVRTSPAIRHMIDLLDKYKEDDKFLGTYAKMRVDPDNRIRCEYKQFGTQSAPGRLSSSQTMWESGMNLQNQPNRARPMFIADDGYVFGYFDLAQAEARYVAWDAWIPTWIEQFERARIDGEFDAHRALASSMFNVPYDEVPKKDHDENNKPTIRYIAKRCRHGLNYRMGYDKLATVTGLSINVAHDAYLLYHKQTPELRRWWDALIRIAMKDRVLFNSLGRQLMLLGRLDDDDALNSIVAYRPQSTIGDKVSAVWRQSEEDEKWPHDARVCLNIHDALICIAPASKVKRCLSIMKHYAEQPIMVTSVITNETNPMIIPAETKMSVPTSWSYDEETRKLTYYEDANGKHRWYGMKAVEVEAV